MFYEKHVFTYIKHVCLKKGMGEKKFSQKLDLQRFFISPLQQSFLIHYSNPYKSQVQCQPTPLNATYVLQHEPLRLPKCIIKG